MRHVKVLPVTEQGYGDQRGLDFVAAGSVSLSIVGRNYGPISRGKQGLKIHCGQLKRVLHPYAVVTKRKISTYELPFGSVIGPRSPQ